MKHVMLRHYVDYTADCIAAIQESCRTFDDFDSIKIACVDWLRVFS